MCNSFLVLFVINFFQVYGAELPLPNHYVSKRSPQQFDIQSISQKQISPDITVVDVVVNEPPNGRYPNQNYYNQPLYPQGQYARPVYPNRPYQNTPNRRQPEIQVIEVIDAPIGNRPNVEPWQRYPGGNQNHIIGVDNPINPGQRNRPDSRPGAGTFIPPGQNRPNRRPYRPNSDFHIEEEDDSSTPIQNNRRRHGHRRRPRPNKNNSDDDSEEETFVFDAGEGQVAGYTKDNFPIIPLSKAEIRR